jgi:hypothetical protein
MFFDKNLDDSYNKVGKKIFKLNSLSSKSIKSSINLFTQISLKKKNPLPIKTEVYALVSGLSFSKDLVLSLVKSQKKIQKILKSTLCYWVKPKNLGVEYCVLKWPNNTWKKKWLKETESFLDSSNYQIFNFLVSGIQIHPDGCIVAKGFDSGFIRKIRSDLLSNLKFFPKKQSNWSHIPLGRILEPISSSRLKEIKKEVKKLSNKYIGMERINHAKIVYETRWYMEKKKTLYIKKFKN